MKVLVIILFSLLVLLAVNTKSIAYEFPVPELGNCRDAKECHLYCEVPRNRAACWSYSVYGVKNEVLGDESPEEKVAQLGITFPIPTLGNCANVAQCKGYCDNPANLTACQTFAQNQGLTLKSRINEKAKTELGCNSAEECRTYCEQEVNRDVCLAFATRYHLKAAIKNRLVEAVQAELGCNGKESCRALCELPENKVRCQTIAQRLGLGENKKEELVERAKEELGCTSFADCRRFCQDKANADRCRNFGQAVGQSIKNKIRDAGDCTTVEECKRICEANPDQCPSFPKPASGSGDRPLKPNNRGSGSLNKGSGNVGQRFFNNKLENKIEDHMEPKFDNATPINAEPINSPTATTPTSNSGSGSSSSDSDTSGSNSGY